MHISVITLFPEMFGALEHGVIGRAIKKQLVTLSYVNPRDYALDAYKTVDDRPYGGGPGMVLKPEPLMAAIHATRKKHSHVIYLSPQGQLLDQEKVNTFCKMEDLVLIAGRYEGIDQRVIESAVDEEISVGDYVLSGGELPAMTLIDALTRQLPGALGHEESAKQDSFMNGLLDCPHYTRPEDYLGQTVPKILLSGDHALIKRWRHKQSLGKTWQMRQDLVKRRPLSINEQLLLEEFKKEHNEE